MLSVYSTQRSVFVIRSVLEGVCALALLQVAAVASLGMVYELLSILWIAGPSERTNIGFYMQGLYYNWSPQKGSVLRMDREFYLGTMGPTSVLRKDPCPFGYPAKAAGCARPWAPMPPAPWRNSIVYVVESSLV